MCYHFYITVIRRAILQKAMTFEVSKHEDELIKLSIFLPRLLFNPHETK